MSVTHNRRSEISNWRDCPDTMTNLAVGTFGLSGGSWFLWCTRLALHPHSSWWFLAASPAIISHKLSIQQVITGRSVRDTQQQILASPVVHKNYLLTSLDLHFELSGKYSNKKFSGYTSMLCRYLLILLLIS